MYVRAFMCVCMCLCMCMPLCIFCELTVCVLSSSTSSSAPCDVIAYDITQNNYQAYIMTQFLDNWSSKDTFVVTSYLSG